MSFLNIDSNEFIRVCSELCRSHISSYIKFNDRYYPINSIVDFLKIKDLNEVAITDIDYNFDLKEKDMLNKLMNHFYGSNFKDVLEKVNNKVIFNKDIVFVAREYAKKVLGLNDTQLKYMDYFNYFKNEVSYEIIDDYIVVFV